MCVLFYINNTCMRDTGPTPGAPDGSVEKKKHEAPKPSGAAHKVELGLGVAARTEGGARFKEYTTWKADFVQMTTDVADDLGIPEDAIDVQLGEVDGALFSISVNTSTNRVEVTFGGNLDADTLDLIENSGIFFAQIEAVRGQVEALQDAGAFAPPAAPEPPPSAPEPQTTTPEPPPAVPEPPPAAPETKAVSAAAQMLDQQVGSVLQGEGGKRYAEYFFIKGDLADLVEAIATEVGLDPTHMELRVAGADASPIEMNIDEATLDPVITFGGSFDAGAMDEIEGGLFTSELEKLKRLMAGEVESAPPAAPEPPPSAPEPQTATPEPPAAAPEPPPATPETKAVSAAAPESPPATTETESISDVQRLVEEKIEAVLKAEGGSRYTDFETFKEDIVGLVEVAIEQLEVGINDVALRVGEAAEPSFNIYANAVDGSVVIAFGGSFDADAMDEIEGGLFTSQVELAQNILTAPSPEEAASGLTPTLADVGGSRLPTEPGTGWDPSQAVDPAEDPWTPTADVPTAAESPAEVERDLEAEKAQLLSQVLDAIGVDLTPVDGGPEIIEKMEREIGNIVDILSQYPPDIVPEVVIKKVRDEHASIKAETKYREGQLIIEIGGDFSSLSDGDKRVLGFSLDDLSDYVDRTMKGHQRDVELSRLRDTRRQERAGREETEDRIVAERMDAWSISETLDFLDKHLSSYPDTVRYLRLLAANGIDTGEDRLKQCLVKIATYSPERTWGPYIGLGDDMLKSIDPEGGSNFSNPELFEAFKASMKQSYGRDVIYPKPGEKYSGALHEMKSSVKAKLVMRKEGTVYAVTSFGFTGSPPRKATVVYVGH